MGISTTTTQNAAESENQPIAMLVSDAPIERPFRYEVTGRGSAWQWRRGSGAQREGYYGGVIETLPEWRRTEYERNKARRSKGKGGRA